MQKVFLLRYDTEAHWTAEPMDGFLETAVAVHRARDIPATFFCQGAAIESRESEFRDFFQEVKDDPLFDIQDHSYSHIGVGYRHGKPVATIKADYERSFAVHERVFGRRPVGVSLCGTSDDGPAEKGFDATEKTRAEFEMLAGLGVKMINAFLTTPTTLTTPDEGDAFIHYAPLGRPDIMGFPSAFGDTGWMFRKEFGDPMQYILAQIDQRAARDRHFPLMLHDWVARNHAPDKRLDFLTQIIDHARNQGYILKTHVECYEETTLWKE